jgi:hypothetical protein
VDFDHDIQKDFLEYRSTKNDEHELEKLALDWIPVRVIRSAIKNLGTAPASHLKLNDHGLDATLRKHFVKMMIKAESLGLLESLEKEEPLQI